MHTTKTSLTAACLAIACLGGAVLPMTATAQGLPVPQIAAEREEVADPPGRAGRLAEVQGTVWLFHPEAGEWVAAERNRPLTSGDRLSTEAGARAEVRLGSTVFRLDAGTELEFLRVDDERVDIDLRAGSLAVRLRSQEATRETSVQTDAGRFTMQRTGRYRFDQREGVSRATVWSGEALFEAPGSALPVAEGQRIDFWLDPSQRAMYRQADAERDGFANWVADADRADDRIVASRYVSPEMTGAEDLERHGRWEQDPEYGPLWVPREIAPDWAPYAVGQWTWVAPWGWTWVDAAPWGFAPFHYGRWVQVRNRWCWTPGRYVARPAYAPALVGWVGGPGVSVSVTVGGGPGVGWFPLAPREPYLPGYRVSPRYVRVVNGPHFRNGGDIERLIQNPVVVLRDVDWRNRRFDRGTTLAPIDAFQRRGPIPIMPQWRGNPVARDIDRLPATPVVAVAPPAWVNTRRDRPRDGVFREGPRDGVFRDGPRDGNWREGRPRDGVPREGWRDLGVPRPDAPRVGPGAPTFPGTPSAGMPSVPRDRDGDRGRGAERPDRPDRPFRSPDEGPARGRPGGPFDAPVARPADPPPAVIPMPRQEPGVAPDRPFRSREERIGDDRPFRPRDERGGDGRARERWERSGGDRFGGMPEAGPRPAAPLPQPQPMPQAQPMPQPQPMPQAQPMPQPQPQPAPRMAAPPQMRAPEAPRPSGPPPAREQRENRPPQQQQQEPPREMSRGYKPQ